MHWHKMYHSNMASICRLFEVYNPKQFNAICQANEVGRPERRKMVFIQLGYVCVHSCEESNYKNFEVAILIYHYQPMMLEPLANIGEHLLFTFVFEQNTTNQNEKTLKQTRYECTVRVSGPEVRGQRCLTF